MEESTVKASQEIAFISPHFKAAMTQYKRGEVISLPRDDTTKKISFLNSFVKGLCSTDLKQYFYSFVVILSKYKVTPLPSF